MLSQGELRELLEKVNSEWNTDKALSLLAKVALTATHSRNSMIARMNDEDGVLELTHGAGSEWSDDLHLKRIQVTTDEGGGIVAFVAAKGESYLTGDVAAEPHYKNLFKTSKSELALPVWDRYRRVRAVINVESDEKDRYMPEDMDTMLFLSELVRLVISRDELLRREQALAEVGVAIDRAQDEQELLTKIILVANEQLRFQSLAIFLHDSSNQQFILRGATGILETHVGNRGYDAGEGLTGWVASEGKVVRLAQPQLDSRWRGRLLEMPEDEIAGYLAVPIIHRGRSIGVIRVIRRKSSNPHHDNSFTEDDEKILVAIAEQLANGIESIRMLKREVFIERMAAWGELSAKSAHMIGNRVFALRGDVNELGYLLQEPDGDPAELIQMHKSLVTNVTRIEELLQEFRDFVTATQLSTVRADLNFVVSEAVTEVFPKRSDVTLEFELTENLAEVQIDVQKIRRAITEIIENALSFFESGSMQVSTSIASQSHLKQARVDLTQQYLEIVITDSGPGVPQDQKQLIFQPFFSSRVKGMGLGLSIVKGILEAHGGAVFEEGEFGKGATFVMLLPASHRS